jgi:hypothetical protein
MPVASRAAATPPGGSLRAPSLPAANRAARRGERAHSHCHPLPARCERHCWRTTSTGPLGVSTVNSSERFATALPPAIGQCPSAAMLQRPPRKSGVSQEDCHSVILPPASDVGIAPTRPLASAQLCLTAPASSSSGVQSRQKPLARLRGGPRGVLSWQGASDTPPLLIFPALNMGICRGKASTATGDRTRTADGPYEGRLSQPGRKPRWARLGCGGHGRAGRSPGLPSKSCLLVPVLAGACPGGSVSTRRRSLVRAQHRPLLCLHRAAPTVKAARPNDRSRQPIPRTPLARPRSERRSRLGGSPHEDSG